MAWRHAAALKRNFDISPAAAHQKRPEHVLWVAVLSRAVLDVRHGTAEEALAVLTWIDRDRDEFKQVVMLAGLELGHAERFERAMRADFEARFRAAPAHVREEQGLGSPEAVT